MNIRMLGIVACGFALGATAAAAQSPDPQCQSQSFSQVRDACQMGVDLFKYVAPQLGAAIAGGNATLGQGGTLGGLGHFSIGLRANVVDGSLPQVDQFSPNTNGIQQHSLPTKDNQPVPMPVADAAFGVFSGIPVGVTNVGGVDVLVNVAYIPNINQSGSSFSTPNGNWKFGYGVRVGVTQESVVVPGISVTYLKRDLPVVSLVGQTGANSSNNSNVQDSLAINDLTIGTTAWRLVANKHFGFLGLAAGVGQDSYTQSASAIATVHVNNQPYRSSTIDISQDDSRTNLFADLSFNFPILKLVGEIGQVSGGSVQTYNTFSKDANASRLYGSVGLRFAW